MDKYLFEYKIINIKFKMGYKYVYITVIEYYPVEIEELKEAWFDAHGKLSPIFATNTFCISNWPAEKVLVTLKITL